MNEIFSQLFLGGGWKKRMERLGKPAPAPKPREEKIIIDAKLSHSRWEGGASIDGCSSPIGGILRIPAEIEGLPVTRIGEAAFFGRDDLMGAQLPDSLTHIDRWAFRQCSNLACAQLPRGLRHIGGGAFEGCGQLGKITIYSGLLELDREAFRGCQALEQALFPDSESYPARDGVVGLYPSYFEAFEGCPGLVIYAPEGSFAQHYAQEYGCRFLPLRDVSAPQPRRWTARLWTMPDSGAVDLRAEGELSFVEWSVFEKPAHFETGEIAVPALAELSPAEFRALLTQTLPPAARKKMDVPSAEQLAAIPALKALWERKTGAMELL